MLPLWPLLQLYNHNPNLQLQIQTNVTESHLTPRGLYKGVFADFSSLQEQGQAVFIKPGLSLYNSTIVAVT